MYNRSQSKNMHMHECDNKSLNLKSSFKSLFVFSIFTFINLSTVNAALTCNLLFDTSNSAQAKLSSSSDENNVKGGSNTGNSQKSDTGVPVTQDSAVHENAKVVDMEKAKLLITSLMQKAMMTYITGFKQFEHSEMRAKIFEKYSKDIDLLITESEKYRVDINSLIHSTSTNILNTLVTGGYVSERSRFVDYKGLTIAELKDGYNPKYSFAPDNVNKTLILTRVESGDQVEIFVKFSPGEKLIDYSFDGEKFVYIITSEGAHRYELDLMKQRLTNKVQVQFASSQDNN